MNTYTGWVPFNKTKAVSEIHTNCMHYMLNNNHHSILFLVPTYHFILTWNDPISVVSQDLVLKKNNFWSRFTITHNSFTYFPFPLCIALWDYSVSQQHTQKLCIMSGLSIIYFITFLVCKQYTLKTCTKHKVPLKMMGKSLLLKVFRHKTQVLDKLELWKELTGVVIILPEGNMNVWTKFHGNPSKRWWDISLKTVNVNLLVVLEQNSEDNQRQ